MIGVWGMGEGWVGGAAREGEVPAPAPLVVVEGCRREVPEVPTRHKLSPRGFAEGDRLLRARLYLGRHQREQAHGA